MPAAAVIIGVMAVETGVAAAIGTAIVGSLTAATVSTAVATAIGSGVISAGLSIAQGAKVSDALKGAVIGGVASFVGASVASSVTSSIASAATDAGYTSIAGSIGKIAGSMAGGGVQSAVGSVLSGKGDPIKALITGGLTAGLTQGAMQAVNGVTSNIPGFNDLAKDYGAAGAATQRAVNAGLAAGILGKDTDKAVVNSVLSSMIGAGKDYVKEGVKDLSSTLQAAYDNVTKTGSALDANSTRQNEIVKDYTMTADSINKQHDELQANLDKYNQAKKEYDAWVPYGRGNTRNTITGEIGQAGKAADLAEANSYAKLVNDALPTYEAARTEAETKLNGLSTELDTLKADLPKLQDTFTTQKAALDTTLADFQKQEEANAQQVVKIFNDTVTAKNDVEKALGAPLDQTQLDAFLKTGDVTAAAKDYIDIKTTDLAEAQAAALKEGYRFDPNDPELAAQFLGVKDEKTTLESLQQFADARATTVQEATDLYKQTYADIYGPDAQVPDPTADDLLAFMPSVPVDVASIPKDYQNVAEDVVKGRIQDQFSQNLGFDSYADRTEAQQALGADRPEADAWNQFKGTSGVVGVTGSDITPTQFAQNNGEATAIKAQADANDLAQVAQTPADQQPADQFGFDTLGQTDQAATRSFAPTQFDNLFAQDQTSSDVVGPPTPADLGVAAADNATVGDVTADIPGAQTAAVETPAVTATPLDLADTQLSTAPTDLSASDLGVANAPVDTSGVSELLNYGKDQGVQTAAFQPSNIMSDAENIGDIGLRSLVSTQPGGTTADSDTAGIASLTDKNLTETTKPDLAAATAGTATNSALTDQDPTKTIGTSILEDKPDDIHGGVQTSGLYSGAENELGASNTLTAKYLNEPEKKQSVEDVGITRGLGTGNDTQTYAEPRPTDQILNAPNADTDKLDQFLSPLRTEKTTLPVSQEPARATQTNLGNNMDEEDFSIEDLINRDRGNVQNNGYTASSPEDLSMEELLNRDRSNVQNNGATGVDESFLKNLTPAERERYLAMQSSDYQAPNYGVQDLGISQGNIDSFNQNYNPAGGFSSQWQTVGSDRIMVNDDGTGIGINTETGEQYALTPEQVSTMIKNGMLNTKQSGYVAATGGTGNTPGGSGKTSGTSGTGTDKIANAITNALTSPKALAAIAGGALGAAGGAKGITPMGLRSLATGSGKQMVQTGAQGTKGHGTVKYFEKKATGGAIKNGLGYLKSAHDGMEDKIDATIDNKRPAKLSGGEFVIPADVVSHLGNGNSEAGAKQLYDLMERVRKARTGTADQGKQINPKKYLPR
jgi:hypothetical protein